MLPASQELSRRRVLMASRRGTSVFIKPGDVLRIGTLYSPAVTVTADFSHDNQRRQHPVPGAADRPLM